MTNNDELALKLKSAADKSVDNFDPNMFILTRDMVAMLAGRDADKKRIAEQQEIIAKQEKWIKDVELTMIATTDREAAAEKLVAELKQDVDAANARVDTKCAQLCNQDEEIEMLRLRIAELEARSVSVKLPDNTQLSEAPEHIWLQTAGEWPATGEFSELTWCSDRQHPDDTLYVRADLAAGIKLEVGE